MEAVGLGDPKAELASPAIPAPKDPLRKARREDEEKELVFMLPYSHPSANVSVAVEIRNVSKCICS